MINNGPRLNSRVYRNFCNELKVKNLDSTPRYPQSNDEAESSNKTLLTALKKCLHSAKGKWIDKLQRVLWAYRNTSRKPTKMSPFALTYGMEAIIPIEIGMPILRTGIPEEANAEAITKDLDMIDELCKAAAIHIASYHQRLKNLYNMWVTPCTLKKQRPGLGHIQ